MEQGDDGNVKFSRMYDEHTDSDNDVAFKATNNRARLGRWSACPCSSRGCEGGCWPKEAQAKQLALLLMFSSLLVVGLVVALLAVTISGNGGGSLAQGNSTAAEPSQAPISGQPCMTPECVAVASEILAKMNLSASPCDDFYSYSCGGWMESTFFPPEKAKWSSFSEVYSSNTQLLKKLLEEPGSAYGGSPSSSAVRKAKDYYAACMNRTAYEQLGGDPLIEMIESLGYWPMISRDGQWNASTWNAQDVLVRLHQLDITPFFSMTVGPDDKNSSVNRILFQQSGVTLSSKDQYNSSNTPKLREAFIQFGVAMAQLLSPSYQLGSNVSERVQMIWDLESSLAAAFVPPEALRDPIAAYNDMSVGDLQGMIGNKLNMTAYLRSMLKKDVNTDDRVVVYTPTYFEKLNRILEEYLTNGEKRMIVADYMIWLLVSSSSSYLSEEFRQRRLILTSVTDGVTSLTARWELCVSRTDGALGFSTGAMYVAANFRPESKQAVDDILAMVRKSFTLGFPSVQWMDPITRKAAIDKAEYITSKVGYPDWLPNATALDDFYNAMNTTPYNQFTNLMSSLRFGVNYRLSKLGTVPDRNEWTMAPAEVNAYYNPPYNVIVFPAGILQKPFYDARYPMSANLGGVGSVVGHEITHAFDDQGGNYDKYGNLVTWWQNASVVAFAERTRCMKDQYGSYVVGNERVNGLLTLGENIADNGGLKAAYKSLEQWQSSRGGVNSAALLPGLNLTHGQLFFVSYAQVWCSYYQPAYAQAALHVDPHSPARYRVIGPLSNSDYFASAFHCPPGSNMNPVNKCTVW